MRRRSRQQQGQATVEIALVLPVIVVLILVVVQAGLLMRDRVLVVHATRAAARSVAVAPDAASARRAVSGLEPDRFTLTLGGDLTPGGLASVIIRARPTRVPLVGAAVSGITLQERLTVRVEGA